MNLTGLIKGLHHVTATVNGAQEDYDFYTKTLGLRLVKETVNFDNEKVYHFYYANANGSPSTVFTTFPYRGQGVRKGTIGTGQATHTVFSVPTSSLDFWQARLKYFEISFSTSDLFGTTILNFKDPSGLNIQLAGAENDEREPVWKYQNITESEAIRGIHHVVLLVKDFHETEAFLQVFGYMVSQSEGNMMLLEAGKGGPGNMLILKTDSDEEQGVNGIGTVHHVAHRVDKLEDSLKIKEYLESQFGLNVTEVRDRKYFKSIYFRIPGGILFEVATSGPGFTVDESLDDLGTSLKLPDWQEPHRARIEANLLKYHK